MPTQVADNDLGRIFRQEHDLNERVLKEVVPARKAQFYLQEAIESAPSRPFFSDGGTFLVEFAWSFDHFHTDYFTLTFEACDGAVHPKDIVSGAAKGNEANFFMDTLERAFNELAPGHGSKRLVRLYEVRKTAQVDYPAGKRDAGVSPLRALCLTLEPIADFDGDGNLIPLGSL